MVFHFADISVVSNTTDFEYVKKKYKKKEIRLNPSFVDTSLFNKNSNEKNINPTRPSLVGRLSKGKKILLTPSKALWLQTFRLTYMEMVCKNMKSRKNL